MLKTKTKAPETRPTHVLKKSSSGRLPVGTLEGLGQNSRYSMADRFNKARLQDTVKGTCSTFVLCTRSTLQDNGNRSSDIVSKRGNRRSFLHTARIFQQHIFSSKTRRLFPSNSESFKTEQICSNRKIQVGQHRQCNCCSESTSLGSEVGLERCISSGSDTHVEQTPTEFCSESASIQIQSPTIRSSLGTLHFHSSCEPGSRSSTSTRLDISNIPGRLADHKSVKVEVDTALGSNITNLEGSRSYIKPQQIRISANSNISIPRSVNQHSNKQYNFNSSELSKTTGEDRYSKKVETGFSTTNAGSVRLNEFCSSGNMESETSHATNSNVASLQMEAITGKVVRQTENRQPTATPFKLVGSEQVRPGQGAVSEKTNLYHSVRCFNGRMGRSYGRQNSSRRVVSDRSVNAHKQPGNASSFQLFESVPGTGKETDSFMPDRQYNCGVLFEKGRGNQISTTVYDCLGDSALVRSESDTLGSVSPSGTSELESRSVESKVSSHGVVTSSCCVQSDCKTCYRSTNGGPVCNKPEQQATILFQPSARTGSLSSRCTDSGLDGVGSLCLPSYSHITISAKKDTGGKLQDHSYSAPLAKEILVHKNFGSVNRTSNKTTLHEQTVGSEWNLSQGPSSVQLPCMDAFTKVRTDKGFSVRAAHYAGKNIRDSSKQVYTARWDLFSSWCATQQINSLQISAAELMEFFIHLLEDKKLSLSTIKGYRSAISHVLGRSYPACCEEMLTDLFKGFSSSLTIKPKNSLPKWDLPVVLYHLMQERSDLR